MKENNEPVIQTSKIKNLNHINWDDYFATFAIMTSLRSKDPDRQVGAVIVSKDNRILSTGYNGAPIGINDDAMPWNKEGGFLNTKYAYVVHAELNAILGYNNDKSLLKGAKIYTTLFPCNECMKAIIQSGITEIIYLDNHSFTKDTCVGSRYMVNVHNRNERLPKITLREYSITDRAKMIIVKSILENRTIIPQEEVKEHDKSLKLETKSTNM